MKGGYPAEMYRCTGISQAGVQKRRACRAEKQDKRGSARRGKGPPDLPKKANGGRVLQGGGKWGLK